MKQHTETLSIERECKHSIRYKSADKNSMNSLGVVYIPKTILMTLNEGSSRIPSKIKVIIESAT